MNICDIFNKIDQKFADKITCDMNYKIG